MYNKSTLIYCASVLGFDNAFYCARGAQHKGDVVNDKEGIESSWALGIAITKLAKKLN